MIFNLISNLDENFQVSKFNAYNHVIAYSLRKEMLKQGFEVNLIKDWSNEKPPTCDHSIVISNVAMNRIRKEPRFHILHKDATKDKFCMWIDSDMGNWEMFDRVFVVNYRHDRKSKLFRYVGWAADPEIFKPEQKETTAFVDSYMTGWYQGKYDHVYEKIRNVLADLKIRTIQPVPEYNKVRRAYWFEMIEAFKQSHFNILTQRGYWGLTNIESQTCGALLIGHVDLHCPTTIPAPINMALWETEQQLKELLCQKVDLEANRKLALENSWSKVVERILENLK